MSIEITPQIRNAVEAENGRPLKLVDNVSQREYYVVTAEQFETMQAIVEDGPVAPSQMYPLIAKTAGDAGWNDPLMDAYDNYDEHRDEG